MNSQTRRVPGAVPQRVSVLLLLLLLAGSALVSGCARMKQYSVDSWIGPLPLTDHGLVEVDPSVH